MYLFIFVVLNILSYGLGQTLLPLPSSATIMLDATNNVQVFTIPNACTMANLYTVTAQSNGIECFNMALLDQNNVMVPITPPNPAVLDFQENAGKTIKVFIRRPNGGNPPCTQETIQLTYLTGTTGACQGTITVEPSNLAMGSDITTLNQTMKPLFNTQSWFYQFGNLVPLSFYVVVVEMTPDNVQPFFDTAVPYPTQYNCHDFIGIKGTNNRFRVIQATTNTLNIGLTAMNPIMFSIQTYLANTVTLNLGNGFMTTTLDSSKFNFYNLPQGMGNMASISISNANVPLMVFVSNTQFPNQFTGGSTPIPVAPNQQQPQTIATNGLIFATVYNPAGNMATATYSIQVSNTAGMPVPQTPTGAPIIAQNTMVLAIPLYAIIIISVGIVVLIAGLIGGLYVYNKYKSKKKQEYKPVAKKESTSTSSQDDTESSDYTDDSYEEPRQYSRRQQRNRSYDDDEDDYDSSDYS